jgi:hypothetical protein
MSAGKRTAFPVNDNSSNQPTSQSFTIPAAPDAAVGDIVIFPMGQNTGTQTFSAPAGWTPLHAQVYSATNMSSQVWAKKLVQADLGSTVTFTTSAGGRMVSDVLIVQGGGAIADIICPEPVVGTTANPFTPPDVITPAGDYFIVKIGFARANPATASQVTLSGTSDITEDAECNTNFGTSPNFALGVYHRTLNAPTQGTWGGAQITANQAITGSHGYTLAIPSAAPSSDIGMRIRVTMEDGTVTTVNAYAIKTDGTLVQVSG